MSDNDADRRPPQSPEEERGVHVSRDSTGAEGTAGPKRSKLGFRLQAQRRDKWDDPVFDNIREPEPAPSAASSAKQEEAEAEKDETEERSPGVLERFTRFFRRGGGNRST